MNKKYTGVAILVAAALVALVVLLHFVPVSTFKIQTRVCEDITSAPMHYRVISGQRSDFNFDKQRLSERCPETMFSCQDPADCGNPRDITLELFVF
ncbi:MAG TPA: hypothetical protein VHB72_04195 [Candidatus Saccharimonadales bacterium]|nr:hypothetical protein [Candidatus Saccharimonadales bacterium]